MSKHGNAHLNDKPHHLYKISDKEENDIFKYGISADPLEKDGLSKRAREQRDYLNLAVGWLRYFVEILIHNIPGRIQAEEIEDQYIEAYRHEYGRKPRGNRKKTKAERLK